MAGLVLLFPVLAFAETSVSDVKVAQRWPWNGLVDIEGDEWHGRVEGHDSRHERRGEHDLRGADRGVEDGEDKTSGLMTVTPSKVKVTVSTAVCPCQAPVT